MALTSPVLSFMATRSTAATDVDLVLFLKAPRNAKRRLAAEIGELATDVAALLWGCALGDMQDWRGPGWFSPAEPRDEAWLVSQLGRTPRMIPQRGANLGERINHVDQDLRSRGSVKIMFIGTDCPGMNSEYLGRAAASLDEYDAVLGPSRDGGVVLMGARRAWPELGDLAWSTDRLHDELSAVCMKLGWTVARLDVRSDIDTVSDLLAARDELANDARPARRDLTEWIIGQADALMTGMSGASSKRL